MTDTGMTFVLRHQLARQRAAHAVATAPDWWEVRIRPKKRDSSINAALHAKLADIAKSREWHGQTLDIEAWKRLFVAAWCRLKGERTVMLPALDGEGVDVVFRHTSRMTQEEVRDLLAYIEAWDAEA